MDTTTIKKLVDGKDDAMKELDDLNKKGIMGWLMLDTDIITASLKHLMILESLLQTPNATFDEKISLALGGVSNLIEQLSEKGLILTSALKDFLLHDNDKDVSKMLELFRNKQRAHSREQ